MRPADKYPDGLSVPIRSEVDIVQVRQKGRALAAKQGFSSGDQTLIAAAISEVARNIVQYAHEGVIELRVVSRQEVAGIRIVARDQGPGIPDVRRALQAGYSTSRSLGLGLPGAVRVVDEFAIQSIVDQGTTVTMTKWGNQGGPVAPPRVHQQARPTEAPNPATKNTRPGAERYRVAWARFSSIPRGLWTWLDGLSWAN